MCNSWTDVWVTPSLLEDLSPHREVVATCLRVETPCSSIDTTPCCNYVLLTFIKLLVNEGCYTKVVTMVIHKISHLIPAITPQHID